jgi:phosphatidate phosphatase APP1
MKERFQKLLSQNPKTMPTPLFFITGSPQQLSSSIEKFLDYHHFPSRIVITKKIHGYNIDPLLNQFKYKVSEIETLFKLYPNIEWTMFGDSGEKDEEVYRYLAKKYPKKIKRFYIRDVKNGDIVVKK